MATSCNAYFCYVFRDILDNRKYESVKDGYDVWKEYVESFGFGRKLGSDFLDEPVNKTFTLAFRVIAEYAGGSTYEMPEVRTVEVTVTPIKVDVFDADKVSLSGTAISSVTEIEKTVENANLYAWYGALSIGNGPVDAVYNCITRLTGVRCKLTSFEITANGAGMDALGQVNITVDYDGRVFHGMGLSTDVIESAALALLHAINNIERTKRIQELREPPKKVDDLVAEHQA